VRVLLTTDTVGGVWDHAATLARGLHEAGCSVLLAVVGEADGERLAALPAGVETAARPYRLEWMQDAEADVEAAGDWLTELAALWRADVAHLNQMAYAARGFPCPVVTAVHSDVLSWLLEVEGRESSADAWTRRYTRWVREGLAASAAVVAPSAYQATRVERFYGRAVDRVIHNGVMAPGRASTGEEKEAVPPPVVLTAARAWDPAKGVRVLDEALERMGPGAPEAHLLGETRAPDGSGFIPRRLRAHGRVERAEVDGWMERAGIYVAPSLYEPFGLAPLEAALRGCALVLSEIGSFRELWEGCAAFFPRGDAEALAEVLAALRDDAPRRAALAAAARARALRRYTAALMVDEYAALYRATVESAGSRPAPRLAAHR
jgi:glycosyltransferase involved in cell wall biosynthesis